MPELASRQHIRDICGVVERALDEARHDVARPRRDRRHAGPGPRRLAAGRRVVREGRRGGRRAAARRRPPSRRPHRVARAAERRAAAAGGRARRLGRPHQPVSGRAPGHVSAAQPHARRCGGRGVRQGGEAARSRLSGRAGDRSAGANRQRSRGRAADDAADARRPQRAGAERRSRFQLQRPEDRGAAPRPRAATARLSEQEIADICASFQRVVVDRAGRPRCSTRRGGIRRRASASPAACRPTAGCARS